MGVDSRPPLWYNVNKSKGGRDTHQPPKINRHGTRSHGKPQGRQPDPAPAISGRRGCTYDRGYMTMTDGPNAWDKPDRTSGAAATA